MLDGLTTSNGIGWSPDGRTMYLADSGPRVIHAFDFDGDAGAISDGRILVTVPDEVGTPDGLTVDAAGDLWIAIWGGGDVRRYSPPASSDESWPSRPSRRRAARSPGLACNGSTSRPPPRTGRTRSVAPTRRQGLDTDSETDATGRPADPFRPDPVWWSSLIGG